MRAEGSRVKNRYRSFLTLSIVLDPQTKIEIFTSIHTQNWHVIFHAIDRTM